MKSLAVCALIFAAGCGTRPQHRYTCAEVLGTPPRPGYIALFPPGWQAEAGVIFEPKTGRSRQQFSFRMWDERGREVCDANGKDVPR